MRVCGVNGSHRRVSLSQTSSYYNFAHRRRPRWLTLQSLQRHCKSSRWQTKRQVLMHEFNDRYEVTRQERAWGQTWENGPPRPLEPLSLPSSASAHPTQRAKLFTLPAVLGKGQSPFAHPNPCRWSELLGLPCCLSATLPRQRPTGPNLDRCRPWSRVR